MKGHERDRRNEIPHVLYINDYITFIVTRSYSIPVHRTYLTTTSYDVMFICPVGAHTHASYSLNNGQSRPTAGSISGTLTRPTSLPGCRRGLPTVPLGQRYTRSTIFEVRGIRGPRYTRSAVYEIHDIRGPRYSRSVVYEVRGIRDPRYTRSAVFEVRGIRGPRYTRSAVHEVRGIRGPRYTRSAVYEVRGTRGPRYTKSAVYEVRGKRGLRYMRCLTACTRPSDV